MGRLWAGGALAALPWRLMAPNPRTAPRAFTFHPGDLGILLWTPPPFLLGPHMALSRHAGPSPSLALGVQRPSLRAKGGMYQGLAGTLLLCTGHWRSRLRPFCGNKVTPQWSAVGLWGAGPRDFVGRSGLLVLAGGWLWGCPLAQGPGWVSETCPRGAAPTSQDQQAPLC